MNELDLFVQAVEYQKKGNLIAAKESYQAHLSYYPNDPDTLYALGLLAAQEDNFSNSLYWLEQAVQAKPSSSIFHNHLGNALKNLNQIDKAIYHYQQALKFEPDYAYAHNNLATIYYKTRQWTLAEHHYQQALKYKPNFYVTHLNLGLLYLAQIKIFPRFIPLAIEKLELALKVYPNLEYLHAHLGSLHLFSDQTTIALVYLKRANELEPRNLEVLNNLGVTYLKQAKLVRAKKFFKKALAFDPRYLEARNNLAAIYLQQNYFRLAIFHYQLYLQLAPNDWDNHYNVATACMAYGRLEDAQWHLQKVIKVNPLSIPALCNLGAVSIKKKQLNQAIEYYKQVIAIEPHHPAAQYILAALQGSKPPHRAPEDYVKNLFNHYAQHFDTHLIKNLHYQLPQQLRNLVDQFLSSTPANEFLLPPWHILDLGCGTGLSGMAFKELSGYLIGIDISEKMVANALEKNCYNELIVDDLIHYLASSTKTYQLILAIDSLVYLGELYDLFQMVYQLLPIKGLWAFSVELGNHSYELTPHARYRHAHDYIAAISHSTHFQIKGFSQQIGRCQDNVGVQLGIFLLQKL